MRDAHRRQPTIRVNGREQPHRPGSVSDLLTRLSLDRSGGGIAVAVNGEVVSRSEWERRELRPGDEIEIVGAVQGG